MDYQFIQTLPELDQFLETIRPAKWISLDTEFLSEGRRHIDLCLVQIATRFGLALIDAIQIEDLSALWERVCQKKTTLIVHSGRSELEFCFRAIGRLPSSLFDVQLAAGFVDTDFTAGYKNLLNKFIRINLPKNETRTNWKRRPLSERQIEYALNDVLYLETLASQLKAKLKARGRYSWFKEETRRWLDNLEKSFGEEKWRQFKGINQLSRKELAIVQSLWVWRQNVAADWKIYPSIILRDDLIIELAKRKSSAPERILAVYGIKERIRDADVVSMISDCIEKALTLNERELPYKTEAIQYQEGSEVVVPFVLTALNQISKQENIAAALLATTQDVRDYLHWRENQRECQEIRLTQGWRKQFLGRFLDEFLTGKIAIRLANDPTNNARRLQWIRVNES